jgi:hypothetical protein
MMDPWGYIYVSHIRYDTKWSVDLFIYHMFVTTQNDPLTYFYITYSLRYKTIRWLILYHIFVTIQNDPLTVESIYFRKVLVGPIIGLVTQHSAVVLLEVLHKTNTNCVQLRPAVCLVCSSTDRGCRICRVLPVSVCVVFSTDRLQRMGLWHAFSRIVCQANRWQEWRFRVSGSGLGFRV